MPPKKSEEDDKATQTRRRIPVPLGAGGYHQPQQANARDAARENSQHAAHNYPCYDGEKREHRGF